jgi:hypothetical protein
MTKFFHEFQQKSCHPLSLFKSLDSKYCQKELEIEKYHFKTRKTFKMHKTNKNYLTKLSSFFLAVLFLLWRLPEVSENSSKNRKLLRNRRKFPRETREFFSEISSQDSWIFLQISFSLRSSRFPLKTTADSHNITVSEASTRFQIALTSHQTRNYFPWKVPFMGKIRFRFSMLASELFRARPRGSRSHFEGGNKLQKLWFISRFPRTYWEFNVKAFASIFSDAFCSCSGDKNAQLLHFCLIRRSRRLTLKFVDAN